MYDTYISLCAHPHISTCTLVFASALSLRVDYNTICTSHKSFSSPPLHHSSSIPRSSYSVIAKSAKKKKKSNWKQQHTLNNCFHSLPLQRRLEVSVSKDAVQRANRFLRQVGRKVIHGKTCNKFVNTWMSDSAREFAQFSRIESGGTSSFPCRRGRRPLIVSVQTTANDPALKLPTACLRTYQHNVYKTHIHILFLRIFWLERWKTRHEKEKVRPTHGRDTSSWMEKTNLLLFFSFLF